MTQGRITTVYAHEAHTVDACDYTPVGVDLADTIEQQSRSLQRPALRHKSAVAAFFWRLGQAIRRYFTYNPAGARPRAWELDVMRGVILLCVTLDHCMSYGLHDIMTPCTSVGIWMQGLAQLYCDSAVRHAMQPFGLWLLAFMSGLTGAFTRSRFHRVFKFWIFCALFMGGYALLHVVWPELVTASLIFNIIAVLTICFTLGWVLDTIKCPTWLRGYLGALLIVVGITFYYKYYILDNANVTSEWLALLVYNDHGRAMSPQNYEPLLPHLGWFLVGGVVGKYLYPDRRTKCKRVLPPKALGPVLIVGKHSLAAYIVLPFAILGLVKLISTIIGLCL